MKNKFNYIRIPLILISILASTFLLIDIYKLDILPIRYYIIITSIIGFINLITILFLVLKSKITKVLGILLSIIIISISFIGFNYTSETNEFLNSAFNNNLIETSTYNVIVLNNNEVNKIEELEGKTLGYLKDKKNPIKILNKKVSTTQTEYEDLYELYDLIIKGEIESALIDAAYIEILSEDFTDINEKIKVIYSFDVETKIEKKKEDVPNIIRPINIYISGSDARSNSISNKSRSDVNMIVTINPNTHKILLTSIPRDYYVQVHGQTGLKDKLTHSGIYGLETSAKTVEDLFNIEINYSIKVGMNAVEEVVDLVDGIEIYSDTAFYSSHIKGWYVKEGINKMNGKKALAYARERYAYVGGDRHRIQNQQQVLEAVLKKALQDKNILLKYDELLTSLSNLYRTDIPRELITAFVKEQLDTMSNWEFETQWVNGEGTSSATHTAPKSKLYVMIPFEEDVKEASTRIKNTLKEK